MIRGKYHNWITSCLSYKPIFCRTRHWLLVTHPVTFLSYILQCNSLRSKSFTRHSLLPIFVRNSLSYALIPMRLLWPLVVRFIVDGRRHSLFRVSSRFWSEIMWPEDFLCIKHSSSDRNGTQGKTEEGKCKRTVDPRTGHEGLRREIEAYIYSFLNLSARCGWVVNPMPRPFYPRG